MKHSCSLLTLAVLLLSIGGPGISSAQQTSNGAASAAEQHRITARELAGDAWQRTVDFLCGPDPNPGNAAETPRSAEAVPLSTPLRPTKALS